MRTRFGRRAISGMVGAGVLTAIHQLAQRIRPDAPRMDVVGMEVMARGMRIAGLGVPDVSTLFKQTLAGDLASNATYYSWIPADTRGATLRRAVALGLVAGVGALTLPRYVAGSDPPHSRSVANNVMTVAWYLAGALATAVTAEILRPRSR